MKKALLTLIVCGMAAGTAFAQFTEETVFQPTQVVGRRINENGEITMTLQSEFTYRGNGKLFRFEIPGYLLTTTYSFDGNYLTNEHTFHQGGHPNFYEDTNLTYENGQVKTLEHIMGQMGSCLYWLYTYYEDGRLARKDEREDYDDYHKHWLYDYENEGKTVIESYWTSWVSQGMLLREKTVYEYDDSYKLLSSLTENYNIEGELTKATLTTYAYTPNGNKESVVKQTLSEDEWVNTSIVQYVYDEQDRLTEQLDGIWNAENGEWKFKKRITFETSEDGQIYTISFYKKSGEGWAWDIFDGQTIFFESYLKSQQTALGFYYYEPLMGSANINQFEITLEEFERPIYWDEKELQQLLHGVYPNPTTGIIHIEGENASEVRVFNMLGQVVKTIQNTNEVSLEGLPQGVYLLRVTMEGGKVFSDKIIKE